MTSVQNISDLIGSEGQDFVVEATRIQPFKKSLHFVLFGLFWIAFISIFFGAFFGPLLKGESVEFESEGVLVVAGPGNLEPLLMPALIIGIFLFIGLIILSWGIYLMFKKGGTFVATSKRLIHLRGSKIRSIPWDQFSGDTEVWGKAKKGDVTLQLRTGHMVSGRNGQKRYVPDVVHLSGIPKPFEIEQMCRKRIVELK